VWGLFDNLILDAGFWILDGGNLRTDSSYLMLDNLWKLLWIVLGIGYWVLVFCFEIETFEK
jgi:hypothetical protein